MFNFTTSEDCLYLNVFVPTSINISTPLPVIFWIYGGSFTSGATILYQAWELANVSDAIVVSINYRVNAFGFLTLPQMNQSLNFGLLDQQLGLQWVSNNIARFGGDPSRVMIIGESAGGGSVSMHLLMPRSWPYYSAALLESPGGWSFPNLTMASAVGATLVQATNCTAVTTSAQLQCLRALNASALFLAVLTSQQLPNFIPCIDGVQLTAQPTVLYSKGMFNTKVPVIVGSNQYEGNYFARQYAEALFNDTLLSLTESQYDALVAVGFYPSYQPSVLSWYAPMAQNEGYFAAFSQALGDAYITCGARNVANYMSAKGVKVYRYLFTHSSENIGPGASNFIGLNATHTSELPYVFDFPYMEDLTFTPEEQVLSSTYIIGYWSRLAYNSDPNVYGAYEWPLYNSSTPQILVLDTTLSTLTYDWNSNGLCDKWNALLLGA